MSTQCETLSAASQRGLFRRFPTGVSVVVAESGTRRAGLTVSSLVSLSLEPQLIGISIATRASLHAVLLDAGAWAVSLLSADQEHVARRFASGPPPDRAWEGIHVRADDSRLLADAAGWITARTVDELPTGDHTLFVGEPVVLEKGPPGPSLVYARRKYRAV